MSNNIPDAEPTPPTKAYITWDGLNLEDQRTAFEEAAGALDEFGLVNKATAGSPGRYYPQDYSNLSTGPTSGRPGLTRNDYDYFRPDEAVPNQIKAIMRQCDIIYNRVGLVKNVIDLMGDFASQGIRIVHPDKKIERFYRNWFDKVKGEERSERFLNNLYRIGNVVVHKQTAKISLGFARNMYSANASADLIITTDEPKVEKREIPWKYTFVDPVFVDVVGGSLASFVGNKLYSIVIPAHVRKMINNPKTPAEKEIVSQLPKPIVDAAKNKKPYPLDPQKVSVFHYKKDDWKAWAYPIIYSIMDDINVIEKLKLADLAALDGAISNIRIFKLGSLEHKIAPTSAAASKLSSILQNNVGGGTMDLVWGPDIELIESKTSVHQFLGEGKYAPHLNSVYAGLGIPPTLTGTFGAAGTTNNFISLKTLTQRLQYGRKVLEAFWNNEMRIVQKAMGFDKPAKLEFDRMDLSNEEAEKALLIQLADRNLISDELLQSKFGFDSEMEKTRLKREKRERKSDKMVQKAGPWHDPQFDNQLKKIVLQTGQAAPSQVGLELDPKKPGEKTSMEMKADLTPKPAPGQGVPPGKKPDDTNKGEPEQGRPKNSKDTTQRQERTFKPQTGASLQIWAMAAQEKISEILNPIFVDFFNKKNMRSLSSVEYTEIEEVKTKVLLSLEPHSEIGVDLVMQKFNTIDSIETKHRFAAYAKHIELLTEQLNRSPNTEETKVAKAYFYESMV